MNKALFFTGLSIFILEFLAVIVYLIQDWITLNNIILFTMGAIIVSVNVVALVLMLVGIFKEEKGGCN